VFTDGLYTKGGTSTHAEGAVPSGFGSLRRAPLNTSRCLRGESAPRPYGRLARRPPALRVPLGQSRVQNKDGTHRSSSVHIAKGEHSPSEVRHDVRVEAAELLNAKQKDGIDIYRHTYTYTQTHTHTHTDTHTHTHTHIYIGSARGEVPHDVRVEAAELLQKIKGGIDI